MAYSEKNKSHVGSVLESACTIPEELRAHISFQFLIQWRDIGSLKLAMVKVFATWGLANMANERLFFPETCLLDPVETQG